MAPSQFTGGRKLSLALLGFTCFTVLFAFCVSSFASEADRARDQGRKPAEVVAFYGIATSQTVVDVGAGGGYFTEFFAKAVGKNGTVIAQQNTRMYDKVKGEFADKLALPNVKVIFEPSDKTGLADNSADVVFLSLLWHHMHYAEGQGEVLPENSKKTLGEFKRILKPGGIFAVIDHRALDKATRSESAALHRAPQQQTIDDIVAQGFEFVGASEALAMPADPRNVAMRDVTRDETDRMMLKFRKPAS